MLGLARILHEAFYCERRKHGIFGSVFSIWTSMYFSTISPQTSEINFVLWARIFSTSAALVTKFRAICGLSTLAHKFVNVFKGNAIRDIASGAKQSRSPKARELGGCRVGSASSQSPQHTLVYLRRHVLRSLL